MCQLFRHLLPPEETFHLSPSLLLFAPPSFFCLKMPPFVRLSLWTILLLESARNIEHTLDSKTGNGISPGVSAEPS